MAKTDLKARIGTKELIAMMTLFVSTDTFLSFPQHATAMTLEAAWMVPLLAAVIALAIFLYVENMLRKHFYGMDIVEVTVDSLGSIAGSVLAIVLGLYFVCETAGVMRQFSEHVTTTVLPNTPILVVGAMYTITIAYIAYHGLEGICRIAYLLMPILLVGAIGLCLLTANWWHPLMLLPIFGAGVSHILFAAASDAAVFMNVLLLCVVYPHAHNPRSLRSVGIWSIVVPALLMAGFIATYNMVFPAIETRLAAFPLYQLARIIYLGRFVQRMESIFIFLWVTVAIVRMGMSLWAAAYLFARGLHWPTPRPAIPALALLCFALSLLPADVGQAVHLVETYLIACGAIIIFGLPVLLVTIGALRRRGTSKERLERA
ncbi:MAG: endospore germination permease [Alicyclobacillus herbarius]|uniref:GerAB/ArcD/ProY family transporter n=1 Tax=Alicyclobacillus herbarius TaxID=122960 RepID=UPI000401B68C|nr:endospore germination permease [Alicyclobacillus herbarius]MCL6631368.1 endospore germination permease [Alicyclobacillus herbarius]